MKKIRIETKSGELVKEFENVIIEDDNFTAKNSDGKIECCLLFDDISSLNLNWKEIEVEEKKPVVRWLWAFGNDTNATLSNSFYSEEEANDFNPKDTMIKLEWSRTEFPS